MNKKTIGIDIDGTITHTWYFIPHLNKKFNKNVDWENNTIYDFAELYEVTHDELKNYFQTDEGKSVMFGQELLPNVLDTINKLDDLYKVYIITARSEEFCSGTKKWLESVGLGHIELYCLGSPDKSKLAKELGCDYFIEDHPTASKDIADKDIKVILVNASYNKETNHKNITRVNDWLEIENYFRKEEML